MTPLTDKKKKLLSRVLRSAFDDRRTNIDDALLIIDIAVDLDLDAEINREMLEDFLIENPDCDKYLKLFNKNRN